MKRIAARGTAAAAGLFLLAACAAQKTAATDGAADVPAEETDLSAEAGDADGGEPAADDGGAGEETEGCSPGEARCGADGGREVCAPSGEWVDEHCGEGSACVGAGACAPVVCERGEKRCDPADAFVVQACNGTRTGWDEDERCGAGFTCEYGACVPATCEPGSTACTADGLVRRCNGEGTGFGDPESCPADTVCDGTECVPVVCAPGTAECVDMARRRVCNLLGSRWDEESCPTGTACAGGECRDVVCAPPLARRCDPVDPLAWRQCNASGTAWGTPTRCPAGQGCREGNCLTQVCTPGATVCAPAGTIRTCDASGTAWGSPVPCPAGQACDGGSCVPVICTPGDSTCASTSAARVCNDSGTRWLVQPCGGGYVCEGTRCALQVCIPGLRQCAGATAIEQCNDRGTGWGAAGSCNAAAGERCFEGGCQSLCARAELADSSAGCLFYAADLDNYSYGSSNVDAAPYAIVVSNTHDTIWASVTVQDRRGPGATWRTRASGSIGPNSLSTFILDPDQHVEDTGRGAGYAYRVTSTIPVVAYQFNPIDSADQFSNDASLLLPMHTLDRQYLAASYRQLWSSDDPERGFLTVVGTEDGTSVDITVKAATVAGGGIGALAAGETYSTTIAEGEVLQLATRDVDGDLTGSAVQASRPVAVFGGAECADVPQHCSWCRDAYATTPAYPPTPWGSCWDPFWGLYYLCPSHDANTCAWCDHLEEQLFPVSTWGTRYVASRVPVMSQGGLVEAALWRVIASQDATTVTLTLEPGVSVRSAAGSATTMALNRGAFWEFELSGSTGLPGDGYVTATKPVLLVQYVEGQECTNTDPFDEHVIGGDPAMILMVPVEQYLAEYVFLTPSTYNANYVVVVKPAAGSVTLDGAAVGGFVNAGGGWQVARAAVGAGVHSIEGSLPFGIVGVGYSPQVSYGYPGGLALRVINPL